MEAEFNWSHPDYAATYEARSDRLKRLRADPAMLAGVKAHYAEHPADFINDWGMTFDPRNAEIGLPTTVPFLLFPKQREFIDFVQRKWLAREDWLAEKSRDMGVSWLCVAFAVWMFLFKPGTVVGFGSRKEEYVDRLGDPKSLFWKVRQFVELLPLEFRPKGWDLKACAPFMRIQNPENGSAIIGEAGDNIGRGNRTSIYFKDESAFYERPETIDAALSQTSNCKGDVSTPNGAGNPFYRKRKGGKVEVFTFNWRDDPRKGDSLVREAAARARPGGAGAGGRHQLRGVGHRCLHPRRPGRRRAAERPGGPRGGRAQEMGPGRGALRRRQVRAHQAPGRVVSEQQSWQKHRHDAAGRARVGHGEGRGAGPDRGRRDRRRRWRLRPAGELAKGSKVQIVAVNSAIRVDDGVNYNVRARIWQDGRAWLKDGPVSLPNDPTLKAELCALKYLYRNGLRLIESKDDAKKRGIKSPDFADSLMLTFAEPVIERSNVDLSDYPVDY
jgi:phage terminase large subunit